MRLPPIYSQMIVKCWSEYYIGKEIQSCGMVIFRTPKLQKYTKTQSCYFITSIDNNQTRTLLFTYDNSNVNLIASFRYNTGEYRAKIYLDTTDPEDIINLFTSQSHEQLFRIGWAAITATPQISIVQHKPTKDTVGKNWVLGDRSISNTSRSTA